MTIVATQPAPLPRYHQKSGRARRRRIAWTITARPRTAATHAQTSPVSNANVSPAVALHVCVTDVTPAIHAPIDTARATPLIPAAPFTARRRAVGPASAA